MCQSCANKKATSPTIPLSVLLALYEADPLLDCDRIFINADQMLVEKENDTTNLFVADGLSLTFYTCTC